MGGRSRRYRQRSQRSDRHGSFPEPPCGMGGKQPLVTSPRKTSRLRRSLQALQCLSNSKHGKDEKFRRSNNFELSGLLEREDSWESSGGSGQGGPEEFEVRSTSPTPSVEGAFDVSQALQPVPEASEEEETDDLSYPDPPISLEDNSDKSKASDYSSEFMTDDSTETSGLPWDSSLSPNNSQGSMDSETRMGIRPIELPPDAGRILAPEKALLVEPKESRGLAEELSSTGQEQYPHAWEPEDVLASEHQSDVSECLSVNSIETGSTGYTTLMDNVMELLERTKSLGESRSSESGVSTSHELKDELDAPCRESSENRNGRELSSRVKELVAKFGGSPERVSKAPREADLFPQDPSFETFGSIEVGDVSSKATDIPSEIIRHDVYHGQGNKGFFWRSHPAVSSSQPICTQGEDLVDTSTSTGEGDPSIDYNNVFSQEELDREHSATGEPTFIHI